MSAVPEINQGLIAFETTHAPDSLEKAAKRSAMQYSVQYNTIQCFAHYNTIQ